MSDIQYSESEVIKKIDQNLNLMFKEILGIYEPFSVNGMKFIQNKEERKQKVSEIKKQIEKVSTEVLDYRNELRDTLQLSYFDADDDYAYDATEFKNQIFPKILWTVKAATTNPDPDLELYKIHYADSNPQDILDTVHTLLVKLETYIQNTANHIRYSKIRTSKDFQLKFFMEDDVILKGVIGNGIRSEITGRLHPQFLPMMTRRNGWGMYFLSGELEEFVLTDNKNRDGIPFRRTQFNWEYDYARFTFFANHIQLKLEELFENEKIYINPELRFGYTNWFLGKISAFNKKKISDLTRWEYNDLF